MKNYYKILEVSENASMEVIEKAYKVLVRRYHPDLQGNNLDTEDKIREVNEAYSVLSDQFLKEQYDRELQYELQKKNQNNFQENDYGRMYRQQQKLKHELAHERYDKERLKRQNQELESEGSSFNNTSFGGLVSLLKNILRHRPTLKSIKSLKKIDLLALLLTVIVIVTLGVILYFLPFTHDWMYRNFIDTPLTSWLFK